QWMDVTEAGRPRHLLVEARVVLHRAGSERVEPRVDRVVPLGQAYVMAHGLRLGQPRQADRTLALQAVEPRCDWLRLGKIHTALRQAARLEDQRLLMVEAPVARERTTFGGRRYCARSCRAALSIHTH